VAREFAADILAQFGRTSLIGSKIFFTSDRSGQSTKEIWSMDYDGKNQAPMTSYKSLTIMPTVSPDGTKLAFYDVRARDPEHHGDVDRDEAPDSFL